MLAWVGVCSCSTRRGVSGLPGDRRIESSSARAAELNPLQPILLRRCEGGEVGDDREDVLMQVDERLRINVRRGKRGEEGVGDLLVNMIETVPEGEDAVDKGRVEGKSGMDIAFSRRCTELVGRAEVESVDER